MFCNAEGGYLDGHNLTHRVIKGICKKAGLPPMRFHDLRHSHGTLLAANSLSPRIISDRLGHSDAGFTMRQYTHTLSGSQAAAVQILDEVLSKEQKSPKNQSSSSWSFGKQKKKDSKRIAKVSN